MSEALVDELCETVAAAPPGARLLPFGGQTKPALSEPGDGVDPLDVSALTGVIDYDPGDLTVTAWAGTPVESLAAELARHGQYLPFDPPFAGLGATLGGTIAAGASGSCALRHGGIRDFVIGVRLIDGTGSLVRGGGRVVKNAAGFDLPKLQCGSIGRLGVLADATLKVFPAPQAHVTIRAAARDIATAAELCAGLVGAGDQLDALDVLDDCTVLARVGGREQALAGRVARLRAQAQADWEELRAPEEESLWRSARDMAWAPRDATLVRAGLTPRGLPRLHGALEATGARWRFALAGNVAWIAWPADSELSALDELLLREGLTGMVLRGPRRREPLGVRLGGAFAQRVRRAIDPQQRFA